MGVNHEAGAGAGDGRDGARGSAAPQSPRPSRPLAPSEPPSPTDTFRIDIGELVLDGFDARTVDPERVSAAFRAELTRLLRERGVPLAADDDGRALDALGGLPPLPATTHPVRLGEALARAVHAGLAGRGAAR
ncbi:hypothetical protein ACIQU6_21400 [Streptomyces sp. NPDC090442]|uniref:hypothetical protein n=1 Tax=Streptomyces sp. NPDC090442 TaxID=3365962 RepID=UPI00381B6D4D